MKRFLILALVVLGILCFSSAAMAEGFTISGDYTSASMDDSLWDNDMTNLAIGGEFAMEPFLVGGLYVTALSFDPEPPAGGEESMNLWGVYGGYSLIADDAFGLAIVGGYFSWAWELSEGTDYMNSAATSFGVGAKGYAIFGPFNVSALYILGISDEFNGELFVAGVIDPPMEYESADPGFSLFELKGTYLFSETFGVYLLYRNISVTDVGDEFGNSGFGLGVQLAF